MQRSSFLILLSLLVAPALCACSGKTLDGGSTGDTTGAGTGSPAEPSGGNGRGTTAGTDVEIPDAPVTGSIGGKAFEAKNVDLTFSKKQNQWFLNVTNYAIDCGAVDGSRNAAEAMVVNIGGVEPKAGTVTIRYADGHGASLQLGVYDTMEKSDTRVVQNGSLRLDNWDETPGATITGGLNLMADDESSVAGTFTAKVCAPR